MNKELVEKIKANPDYQTLVKKKQFCASFEHGYFGGLLRVYSHYRV